MSGTRICPFCGKETDKFIMFRGDIVGCRYCGIHVKQTNADRIRAMTDEELAEYIDKHTSEAMWCKNPPLECPEGEECVKCILDWLRQEARD